jgi:hypothetical protein
MASATTSAAVVEFIVLFLAFSVAIVIHADRVGAMHMRGFHLIFTYTFLPKPNHIIFLKILRKNIVTNRFKMLHTQTSI